MPSLSGDTSNKSWVFIWNKSVTPFSKKVETGSSALLGRIAAADGTGRQGGANPCYLFWIKIACGVSGASNLPRENRESSAPNFLPQRCENLTDSNMVVSEWWSSGTQVLCLVSEFPNICRGKSITLPLNSFRESFRGSIPSWGYEDLAYCKGLTKCVRTWQEQSFYFSNKDN